MSTEISSSIPAAPLPQTVVRAKAHDFTTLRDSIVRISQLSRPERRASGRVTEDDLFAGIAHHRIASSHPRALVRFEHTFGIELSRARSHRSDAPVMNAAERALRQLVRESLLSLDDYRLIQSDAFGRAQLDLDRTWISRRGSTVEELNAARTIDEATKSAEAGKPATWQELAIYNSRERALARARWISQAPRSPTQTPGATTPIGASPVSAGGHSEQVDNPTFLWKPISDSDGKLVILLPSALTGEVESVVLWSSDLGELLAEGRFAGVANGGREHFRFGVSGQEFPPGTVVEVTLKSGERRRIVIDNTAERAESIRGLRRID